MVEAAEIKSQSMMEMHRMTLEAQRVENGSRRDFERQKHEQLMEASRQQHEVAMETSRQQTLMLQIQLEKSKEQNA